MSEEFNDVITHDESNTHTRGTMWSWDTTTKEVVNPILLQFLDTHPHTRTPKDEDRRRRRRPCCLRHRLLPTRRSSHFHRSFQRTHQVRRILPNRPFLSLPVLPVDPMTYKWSLTVLIIDFFFFCCCFGVLVHPFLPLFLHRPSQGSRWNARHP